MGESLVIRSYGGQHAGEDDFSEWMEAHQHALALYCRYLTGSDWEGQDLLQEMWLKVWVAKKQQSRLKINRSYLRRTAYHAWVDRCRKPDAQLHTGQAELQLHDKAQPGGVDSAAVYTAFENLVIYLTSSQRAALLLMDIYRFTAAEAAELLKTTEGAVKASLYRARLNLKKLNTKESELSGLSRKDSTGTFDTEVNTEADAAVVAAYMDAFRFHDIAALIALFNGEEQQRTVPVMRRIKDTARPEQETIVYKMEETDWGKFTLKSTEAANAKRNRIVSTGLVTEFGGVGTANEPDVQEWMAKMEAKGIDFKGWNKGAGAPLTLKLSA